MIPNVAFTLAVMRITVRTAASFTRTRITLPLTRMRISPLTYTSKVKILYIGIITAPLGEKFRNSETCW